ncbi:MAG: hypothetical protein IPO21_05730 [Bacteroidales bacterium]|nr:hypothetical protein [Bacteroidales bacterium]
MLRDTVTKWICCATINKDSSELQSTGVIYTGAELGTNPAAVALGCYHTTHCLLMWLLKK